VAFVPVKGEIVLMEINVRVQKPVKQEKIVRFYAKQDKDLQECLHCRYFYGNSRWCIAQHCTKEMEGLQEQVDKNSPCYGCAYKKQEGGCFPCMKKILGKDGIGWGA
jgi:hypothetical protein